MKKIDLRKFDVRTLVRFADGFVNILQSESIRKYMAIVIIVMQVGFVGYAFASGEGGIEGTTFYENDGIEESLGFDPGTDTSLSNVTNQATGLIVLGNVMIAGDELNASAQRDGQPANIGLLGMVDNLTMDALYHPPSTDVTQYIAQDWVPGYETTDTSVYADGYDYLQSMNIDDLHENARMVSYIIFVIILIVAGFMIMFRQKIGGQMMVTIFNTLPKVVLGLVLVTFSFAIVGLILDFGAVLITISAAILGVGSDAIYVTNPFSLLQIGLQGFDSSGVGTAPALGVTGLATGLISYFGSSTAVGAATVFGVGLSPIGVVIGIVIALIGLIILGIFLWASLRVYITLVKAFLGIVLDTILAPIFLTIAVAPGRGGIGWSWFYRVLKNTLTFVGVFFMVNLALVLYTSDINLAFPAGLSSGDLSNTSSGASGLDLLLKFLIPFVLLWMAAEVPQFLGDFLPAAAGGKGAGGAMQNVQKSMSKLPGVGSFLG